MSCAVSSLCQLLLQCAALDLSRLCQPFPLQYLNDLSDTTARHLSTQQDGLFQKVNWYSILAYALAFAFGFEPAKTVFPVLRQVSAQGTFGYACLLAYTGFDLSGLGSIQILCQQRG
jgi:hypothetical protein